MSMTTPNSWLVSAAMRKRSSRPPRASRYSRRPTRSRRGGVGQGLEGGVAPRAPGARDVGHLRAGDDVVELVDEPEHLGRAVVAGAREAVLDDRADAARVGGEHDDAVGHVGDLLDVVAHHQDARRVLGLLAPRCRAPRRAGLGGQRVDLAEGLVHEEHLGPRGEGARHAHALLHPAGELARVGLLEAGRGPTIRMAPGDALLDLARGSRPAALSTISMFPVTVIHG